MEQAAVDRAQQGITGSFSHVPPEESSSIFSIALGPRVVRTMSDTACANRNTVTYSRLPVTESVGQIQQSHHAMSFELPAKFTLAAMMLPDCAFLPVSLFVLPVSTAIGACISVRIG